MVQKISFCLILIMFLLACATTQKYDVALNGLLNQPQSKLTAKFGKPSAQKIIDKHTKIVTYTNLETMYVPSEFYEYNDQPFPGVDDIYYPFADMYNYNPMQQYLGVEVSRVCQTSFLIYDGIIRGWSWSGNNCVAR